MFGSQQSRLPYPTLIGHRAQLAAKNFFHPLEWRKVRPKRVFRIAAAFVPNGSIGGVHDMLVCGRAKLPEFVVTADRNPVPADDERTVAARVHGRRIVDSGNKIAVAEPTVFRDTVRAREIEPVMPAADRNFASELATLVPATRFDPTVRIKNHRVVVAASYILDRLIKPVPFFRIGVPEGRRTQLSELVRTDHTKITGSGHCRQMGQAGRDLANFR